MTNPNTNTAHGEQYVDHLVVIAVQQLCDGRGRAKKARVFEYLSEKDISPDATKTAIRRLTASGKMEETADDAIRLTYQ